MTPTFHLIANAHLDPVWMWDWREGFNTGLTTVRTILNLMDEYSDLTFIRGEAAIYQHIEDTEPDTFARIRAFIESGRWDVVGGVWVQPDTNLPATETFCRHFEVGNKYFQSRFGARPTIGWAADSFGFSAGIPEILAHAGMTGLAFTRPFEEQFHLEKPAFWWRGAGGAKILGYRPPVGIYTCDRDGITPLLDRSIECAGSDGLENIGVFYGLGDHGGGPTRRLLDEIAAWRQAHPEVNVVHSGLHRLFADLQKEVKEKGEGFLPEHQGEMNYTLRGCYSAASRVKFTYRKLESLAARAEAASTLVRANAASTPLLARHEAQLSGVWRDVLFNSFHDILPGSSIERALEEQIEWMGGGLHTARKVEFEALNALARHADTDVPEVAYDQPQAVPFVIWNPQPHEYSGYVELETCLDDRPLYQYQNRFAEVPIEVRLPDGNLAPFQNIALESDMPRGLPWRYRALVPVTIPALGYGVVSLGYVEGASTPALETKVAARESDGELSIENEMFCIKAKIGESIQIEKQGVAWLRGGLAVQVMEDPWGSWGDFEETEAGCDIRELRESWRVSHAQILERGPLRAALWVRLQDENNGGKSWLDLTFGLSHQRHAVDVAARVLWNERSARLKIGFPIDDPSAPLKTVFDVPGGQAQRTPCGEVPARRWASVQKSDGEIFGFASDAITNFQLGDGVLNVTPVRATRYSADCTLESEAEVWLPAVDAGELKFKFLLTADGSALPRLARELETPVVAQQVAPSGGEWPRQKSLAALQPDSLELLAIAPREGGYAIRVFNHNEEKVEAQWTQDGQASTLGTVSGQAIATFSVNSAGC